ncbi:DUF4105 domain-containing protein [Flavobacterium sp. N3904]|uniref:DUF4105 domain-containing protein n=1 Tax=Flavobacterium sp. N3904 TaxID=2986835 RepID=UPI002224D1FE|nr:DUF4105 domain-containing protein [Flavobacterium sp. N3904]
MRASFFYNTFIFIFLLTATHHLFAQNTVLSKNAHVSVITCGTGNESYSLFGHTAIRVQDVDNNLDVVYNYGAFDFDTPNFVMQFIKGDLNYFIVVHRFSDFMNEYNYEKRSVYEQDLNISLPLKQKLYDNLAKTLLSDERVYNYKFIDNNCTSKVVDIINTTLGSKVIIKKADTDLTYRAILFPYFDNHFYEKLGTSIIFGRKLDHDGSKIFLPFELQKSLKLINYNKQPLCPENKELLVFDKEIPSSWWNNCYTYLFILGLVIFVNKKAIDFIYLFTVALFGLFFVFLGFYSSHQELGYNYNILLFNPTLFILFYFYVTKNKKCIYKLAFFNIITLLLYFFLVVNKVHLLIITPLLITNLVVLTRLALRNKKRIPIII